MSSGNYEAVADSLPMPGRSTHQICPDCGTEHFEKRCPSCAERDRLVAMVARKETWATIDGALTYAGPWGAPDWGNPSADGERRVLESYEEGNGLQWVCVDLGENKRTWVKVGLKHHVTLYKRAVRD